MSYVYLWTWKGNAQLPAFCHGGQSGFFFENHNKYHLQMRNWSTKCSFYRSSINIVLQIKMYLMTSVSILLRCFDCSLNFWSTVQSRTLSLPCNTVLPRMRRRTCMRMRKSRAGHPRVYLARKAGYVSEGESTGPSGISLRLSSAYNKREES